MELQTVEKKYGRSLAAFAASECELMRFARRVIRYTEKSEGAKLELLFSLPGIYAMELCFGGKKIRLIKEGDVFRTMGRSEKSRILLSVTIEDQDALGKLAAGKCTVNQCAAQGRLTFRGSIRFFCVFTRICNEGDKVLLSSGRYGALYRTEKQEYV